MVNNHGVLMVTWAAGTHLPVTVYGPFQGGGIRAGSLQATAVTVANNSAIGYTHTTPGTVPRRYPIPAGASGGGGIAGSTLSLVNSTVTGNALLSPDHSLDVSAARPQGAAILGGALHLDHTTIAAHAFAATLQVTTLHSMRSGVTASGDVLCAPGVSTNAASAHNSYTDATCAPDTNQPITPDLLLAPLADNGGPVRTRAPFAVSPLIDKVPAGACTLTTDARGMNRPQGSACDIGAVELVPVASGGPADLSLSFTSVPATIEPSGRVILDLTLSN